MENQQLTSKQIMLNNGLILGIVSILIAVLNFAFGDVYDPHWSINMISMAITIVVIVYALKQLKQSNGGFLSLGESLKLGLGIALISGILFVIYFALFTNFIEPEYFTRMQEVSYAKIVETYPTWTDEQIEQAVEMNKKMSSFGMVTAMILIMSLFFGFIVSLIAGLVMKKSREED